MPFIELSLGPTYGSSLIPLYSFISNSLYLFEVAPDIASFACLPVPLHEESRKEINRNVNT